MFDSETELMRSDLYLYFSETMRAVNHDISLLAMKCTFSTIVCPE